MGGGLVVAEVALCLWRERGEVAALWLEPQEGAKRRLGPSSAEQSGERRCDASKQYRGEPRRDEWSGRAAILAQQ